MGATTWLSEKMGWDVQQPKENRMFPSHVNNHRGGPLGAANDARGVMTTANSAGWHLGLDGECGNVGKGGGFLGPVAGPIMSGIGGVMNLAGAYGREDGWKNNGIMGASAGANMQGLGGGLGVLASGAGCGLFGSVRWRWRCRCFMYCSRPPLFDHGHEETKQPGQWWRSTPSPQDSVGMMMVGAGLEIARTGRDLFGGGDGVMGTIGLD